MDRYFGSSSPTSSGSMNELWEEDLWPLDTEEAAVEGVHDRKDGQFVIHSTGFHRSLRMIPTIGDSSSDGRIQHHHQSAPVDVPDWSKQLGVDLNEQKPDADDFDMAGGEEEEERVPPHEYLARCRFFRTSSVWVGVGLKGRDMSRFRNAVWRQTGFLG